MANSYTQFSFIVPALPEEAQLMLEAAKTCHEIDNLDAEERLAIYPGKSEAFRNAFSIAENEADPFADFCSIFLDPDCPGFGGHLETNPDGIWIHGDEGDMGAIAELVKVCAPSVLPFSFEWAQTCDKHKLGEFGGGFFIVTKDELIGGGTNFLMEQALESLKNDS